MIKIIIDIKSYHLHRLFIANCNISGNIFIADKQLASPVTSNVNKTDDAMFEYQLNILKIPKSASL